MEKIVLLNDKFDTHYFENIKNLSLINTFGTSRVSNPDKVKTLQIFNNKDTQDPKKIKKFVKLNKLHLCISNNELLHLVIACI